MRTGARRWRDKAMHRNAPRRNRVTPWGEIIATPARGTFMGNRGVLHNAAGHIKRPWQLKRWIVCVLEFRGRRRQVMTPGRYTELFFLDEATALTAGHRPCAECRRDRFLAFCDAWRASHSCRQGRRRPSATDIDSCLHAERTADGYRCNLGSLPDGVFVTVPAWGEQAYLVWGERLLAWSPRGYGEDRRRPKGADVHVLTPRPTVAAIQAGYVPDVHASGRDRVGRECMGTGALFSDARLKF
jgi:hypothetical protein